MSASDRKKALLASQQYVAALAEKQETVLAQIHAAFDADVEAQLRFQGALIKGELAPGDLPIPRNLKPKTPEPRVDFSGGTLKHRIFRYFAIKDDRKTPEEIAAGIGESDPQRILYALRDARAKNGLLEAPVDGRWSRSPKGYKYSDDLLGELLGHNAEGTADEGEMTK